MFVAEFPLKESIFFLFTPTHCFYEGLDHSGLHSLNRWRRPLLCSSPENGKGKDTRNSWEGVGDRQRARRAHHRRCHATSSLRSTDVKERRQWRRGGKPCCFPGGCPNRRQTFGLEISLPMGKSVASRILRVSMFGHTFTIVISFSINRITESINLPI